MCRQNNKNPEFVIKKNNRICKNISNIQLLKTDIEKILKYSTLHKGEGMLESIVILYSSILLQEQLILNHLSFETQISYTYITQDFSDNNIIAFLNNLRNCSIVVMCIKNHVSTLIKQSDNNYLLYDTGSAHYNFLKNMLGAYNKNVSLLNFVISYTIARNNVIEQAANTFFIQKHGTCAYHSCFFSVYSFLFIEKQIRKSNDAIVNIDLFPTICTYLNKLSSLIDVDFYKTKHKVIYQRNRLFDISVKSCKNYEKYKFNNKNIYINKTTDSHCVDEIALNDMIKLYIDNENFKLATRYQPQKNSFKFNVENIRLQQLQQEESDSSILTQLSSSTEILEQQESMQSDVQQIQNVSQIETPKQDTAKLTQSTTQQNRAIRYKKIVAQNKLHK